MGIAVENVLPGTYLVINRAWKSGDMIEINFDMSVRFWIGEDKCEGKTSVYYGPVLLAMDSASFACHRLQTWKLPQLNKLPLRKIPRFWFYGSVNTADGKEIDTC